MKVTVIAHPKSKKPRLTQREPGVFDVYISQVPENGLANEAIARSLALYFKVSIGRIKLVKGAKSKSKVFEVLV